MRRIVVAVVFAVVAGLGLAVVAGSVAAGGGGCHEATEGSVTTVDLTAYCFDPSVVHVSAGDTVTFVNRDEARHVITGIDWALGELHEGDQRSQRFDDAGIYPYACYLHPSMTGAVVVGDATADLAVAPVAAIDDPESSGAALPAAIAAGFGGIAVGLVAALGLLRRRAAA